MSDKPNKYSFSNKSKAAVEPEKPKEEEKEFVLMWRTPVVLENQVYFPGDLVSEEIVNKMPKFLKPHFWKKGNELPPHVFNKLAKNLQRYFKEFKPKNNTEV